MTKLLVQGPTILACGLFVDDGENIRSYNPDGSADAIWPKHVIDGWDIVDVDVPSEFVLGQYEWNGSTIVKTAERLAQDKMEQIQALKEQIASIEEANPITARALREQGLIIAQIILQVTGAPPGGPAFSTAQEVNDEIVALRAQIKQLQDAP